MNATQYLTHCLANGYKLHGTMLRAKDGRLEFIHATKAPRDGNYIAIYHELSDGCMVPSGMEPVQARIEDTPVPLWEFQMMEKGCKAAQHYQDKAEEQAQFLADKMRELVTALGDAIPDEAMAVIDAVRERIIIEVPA